ncbi:MAG: helix-turn-helix domain-containing protein [Actinomycetota bacterium]|nr:helix-turn-helix domain-containing protein [Actinomycetota bacterium]
MGLDELLVAEAGDGPALSVVELGDVDLIGAPREGPKQLGFVVLAEVGSTLLQWLLSVRVRRAQELLEISGDSIERVASRSGFGSASALRRHFQHAVGVSPTEYRRALGYRPYALASPEQAA